MLVAGSYRFRDGADQAAGLKRFTSWTPPAGFSFQGHWARSDGNGGFFIAEADSGAAIFEAAGAFSDFINFEIVPVIDIMDSVPISMRVLDWIASLG